MYLSSFILFVVLSYEKNKNHGDANGSLRRPYDNIRKPY